MHMQIYDYSRYIYIYVWYTNICIYDILMYAERKTAVVQVVFGIQNWELEARKPILK